MLSEEQLWQLYSVAKRCQWFETVAHAQKEFGIEAKVSRSAYYRWLDWMRGEESERRLAQARIAALEVDDLAKVVDLKDEKTIAAYKSLAAEFALRSDAKTASKFLHMALSLRDRQLKSQEVELKGRDIDRKEEELKIAQEKLKLEQAKSSQAVAALDAPQLTDAERIDKIKSIFGMK